MPPFISSHLFFCHAKNADQMLPGSSAGIVSLELLCPQRFSRRFCTWKVMRTLQDYRGQSSGIHQEGWSFQLTKGDRSSWFQQEERSSQEPKGGRSSRGHKEGRVPASSPPPKYTRSPVPRSWWPFPLLTLYSRFVLPVQKHPDLTSFKFLWKDPLLHTSLRVHVVQACWENGLEYFFFLSRSVKTVQQDFRNFLW